MSDYQRRAEEAVADTAKHIHGPDTSYRGKIPLGETWAITFSKNRDSGVLERTNYDTILDDLYKRFPKSVNSVTFSHWGVGWIEYVAVKMLDSRGKVTKAGIAALDWQGALENYPVADDEAYSKAEYEELIGSIQVNFHLTEADADDVISNMHEPVADYSEKDVLQAIYKTREQQLAAAGLQPDTIKAVFRWLQTSRTGLTSDFQDAHTLIATLKKTLSDHDVRRILDWLVDAEIGPDEAGTSEVSAKIEDVIERLGVRPEDRETLPLFHGFRRR